MAAYTPPPSPGGLRSSRKRALEIGTNPSGFAGQVGYDAHAGVPLVQGVTTAGHYKEQPPMISGAGGAINTSVPFANLKK